MNARAENGSSSEGALSISTEGSPCLKPLIAPTSNGLGRYLTTASNICCTPLFLNAEPIITGTTEKLTVPLRIAAIICSLEGSFSSMNNSIIESSMSASFSIISARLAFASSNIFAGISKVSNSSPLFASKSQT